jgi:hypothetical protein
MREQFAQRRLHLRLVLLGRQVQDLQILLVRMRRLSHPQIIVGHAEIVRREQGRTMLVHRKRARFAHQPVDHVPIVDVVLVAPTLPRQMLHQLLRVPHFQVFHVHTHFHVLADQPARHRVTIAFHVNLTARVHLHTHPLARFQTPRRQRLHLGQLLRQSFAPIRVELI